MTSKARGMPDVSLSIKTVEALEAEKIANTPKPEAEIFQKSVKFEEQPDRPTTNLGLDGSRPTTNIVDKKPDKRSNQVDKPKKKLTEKQIAGLKKGRERSLEIRRAKKEAKNKAPKNHVEEPKPQTYLQPVAQPQPAMYQQPPVYNLAPPSIDYDKIINGMAERFKMPTQPAMPTIPEQPAFDRKKFEDDIRIDEKRKILEEIEFLQKEAEKKERLKTTQQVYQAPSNFNYAFEMNSRKRYNRY